MRFEVFMVDDLPADSGVEPAIRLEIAPGLSDVGSITSVAFSRDGKTLVAGDGRGFLRLYDRTTATEREAIPIKPTGGSIKFLTYTPGGEALVGAIGPGEVGLMDAADGQLRATMNLASYPLQPQSMPTSLAISPDGATIAAGDLFGRITLWERPGGRVKSVLPPRVIPSHLWEGMNPRVVPAMPAAVIGLAFTPDGATLVSTDTSGNDSTPDATAIRFWNLATGKERVRPIGQAKGCRPIFSPDGDSLAIVDEVGDPLDSRSRATLWDTADWKRRCSIGDLRMLAGIAFLRDRRRLVTLEEDRVVRLWDAERGEELTRLRFDRHSRATCLAISPDGRLIAAGGYFSDAMFGMIQLIEVDGATLRPFKPRAKTP